jgi:hypothetical protein
MRYAVFVAAMTAQTAVAAGAPESRAPTLAEQRSFEQFMQRTAPGAPLPALHAERARGSGQWEVSAVADAPPVRLVLPLCRVTRTRYALQPDDSWRGATSQYVWIHHTTSCGGPPPTMVEVRAPLEEIDILRLIQAQGELLQRARLLMAGNTGCAPVRSRNFQLRAVGRGADGLYQLGYESDIGSRLDVAVRQARAELTAWNVSCR